MSKEDLAIWDYLERRNRVFQVLRSYLTGQYWLMQANGLIH